MTFDNRTALEEAIESCSESVRVLRVKMHKNEEAVEMKDVAKEVQRLIGLRKELQNWVRKEKMDEAGKYQEIETPETYEADNQLEAETLETEEANDELVVSDSKLEQRTIELESRMMEADEKLLMLETEVMRIERTKKALTYLRQHETINGTEVEVVAEHNTVVKNSLKKTKKKNKKVKEEKVVSTGLEMVEDADRMVNLRVQPGVKVLEATQTAEKLQKAVNVPTHEKSKAFAKLTTDDKGKSIKTKQTSRTDRVAQKVEQGLRDVQTKLEQKVNAITQEEAELMAEMTAELDKERLMFTQYSQSNEKARSELEKSNAKLAKENAALVKKLQAEGNATKAIRDELDKLQNELSQIKDEKESRETHLGKLWKNIEDLQLANKKIKEKNVLLKADAKAIRAAAEKSIVKHSLHDDKIKMLTTDVESATAELAKSKNEVIKLQAVAEKLQSEVKVSNSEVVCSKERVQTLEKELKVAKMTALESSSKHNNLRKLIKEAEAKSATSNERIQTLEKAVESSKQNGLELAAECDTLRKSSKEAERTYKEKIDELTSQISQLQSATEEKSGGLAAELKKAKEIAKVAVAEKEALARRLLGLKDDVLQLELAKKEALAMASRNDSVLKKLAVDLDTRTDELKKAKASFDDLNSQRTNALNQLQDLRGIAATNEEMLKKARASLLEANEELKEARANALKWKNSAQAAKILMNAKIADFESASKQLKKARADAASAGTARSQLTLSLRSKETRLVKTKQELVAVRTELTTALGTIETERTQLKEEHKTQVAKLREVFNHKAAQLNSQVQSYRVILAILLSTLVALSVYAVSQ